MPILPAPTPVDIRTVGQSWTQTNAANFGYTQMPVALCLDRRSGRSATTYELPDFDNAMGKALGLRDWEPGQALPTERTVAATPVTFTPRGVTTRIISRPQNRPMNFVFRDLESNVIPILLSELSLGIEAELFALLGTAGALGVGANWDSVTVAGVAAPNIAAQFSDGAGAASTSPLEDFGGNAIQPDADINIQCRRFRKFQGLNGMALECWVSGHVLDILARHPVYSGAGGGPGMLTAAAAQNAGIAAILPRDVFITRFMAAHRLDRVVVMDSVTDTARAGQVPVENFTANGLLWFGLVDRRGGDFDLRSEGSLDSPDGAICYAKAREPEVATWSSPGMETDSFAARASFELFSPRGQTFGVTFAPTAATSPSGTSGIFAALPV